MIEAEKQTSIQIKGIKDGLLVTFSEGENWEEQKRDLFEQISEKESFFRGAKIWLDVNSRDILSAEMGEIRNKLSDLGVNLRAVISHSEITDRTSQMLGLATKIQPAKNEKPANRVETEQDHNPPLWVQRTIRSGVKLNHPGNITILGDVNPGGEVEASGSILVWGKLRGEAHAGIDGNVHAVICALGLNPTGFSIAGKSVEFTPARKTKSQPGMVSLEDSTIKITFWKA